MKIVPRYCAVLLPVSGFLLASTSEALSYFDPGTGSIMLQAILGGIAGGVFLMRRQWGRLTSAVGAILTRMRRERQE